MKAWIAIIAATTISVALTGQIRDAPAPRPVGTATLSGVVRAADDSGAPVRLARVTLNSVDRGGAAETATTDDQGRFVFRRLPAGRYSLQATKRAWLDASYGASRLGRPGIPVAIRDGEIRASVEIRMTRGSVIAGTVRDASGEPQPGVRIRVMRFVTRDGQRALERPIGPSNMNDPITDDEGAYRFFGLPPGDYLVVGAVTISQSGGLGGEEIRVQGSAGPTVTNAPVFFPGTPDMGTAATVTLGPGEQRLGVDIPFALYPTARVTGRVTTPTGAPAPPAADRSGRAECRMTPAGFEDLLTQPLAAATATVNPDGRMEFPGVPPGRYTVVCAVGNPSGSGGPNLAGFGEASIVVSGQDQEFAMIFGPPSSLSGRVVFEGATTPVDPTSIGLIGVRGFGRARLLRANFDTPPKADGTFLFNSLTSGRWAVGVPVQRNSPWTLKSMTLGGHDVMDAFIDVSAGDQLSDLVITMTDRPSELAGDLQDTTGRPASEYFVLAFSADRATWTPTSRRIQTVRPASDGTFSMKGLPAGEDPLAALTDVEPGEWLSPAFLDQVVSGAVRVRIADGQKTTQQLYVSRADALRSRRGA